MVVRAYYHSETNVTLGSGQVITSSYLKDQCSYWSELLGIYSIATTILELSSYHDLGRGAITVACNGEIALH